MQTQAPLRLKQGKFDGAPLRILSMTPLPKGERWSFETSAGTFEVEATNYGGGAALTLPDGSTLTHQRQLAWQQEAWPDTRGLSTRGIVEDAAWLRTFKEHERKGHVERAFWAAVWAAQPAT